MADENEQSAQDRVTLVTTDVLTPYRKGEVFTVSREEADRLLTRDMTENDFGPKNEKVRVRVFKPEEDSQLLLDNGVLNAIEAKKLRAKLQLKD